MKKHLIFTWHLMSYQSIQRLCCMYNNIVIICYLLPGSTVFVDTSIDSL